MAGFIANDYTSAVRVLGLGNELLADDAFGLRVAAQIRLGFGQAVDVICSSASGLHLLDEVLGAERLLVVDSMITGEEQPGTIRVFDGAEVRAAPGGSAHASGLFDALAVARQAGLAAPRQVTIIAVEASDCTTLGGAMHPAVEAAVAHAVEIAGRLIRNGEAHA